MAAKMLRRHKEERTYIRAGAHSMGAAPDLHNDLSLSLLCLLAAILLPDVG